MGEKLVVGSHHLAQEMARAGHQVVHMSTPVTMAHLGLVRRETGGIRYDARLANWWHSGAFIEPNLLNYVPFALLPWPVARTVARFGKNPYWMCIPPIRNVLKRIGFSPVDILFVDQPRFSGLESVIRPRAMIYRAADLYEELAEDPVLGLLERRLVANADALVGTSKPILSRLQSWAPEKPSMLLTNGADYEHFSRPVPPPPEYKSLEHPRLVYEGSLDKRFDVTAVRVLAQRVTCGSIILIGPHDRGVVRALSGLPRVHLMGPRPYELLPAYLRHSDVGLVLLNDHPSNTGRSPLKLFEYASAGLTVVAKDTPVLRGSKMPFVHLYRTHEELGQAVSRALVTGTDTAAIQARAALESWTSKTDALLRFASDVLATKSRRPG
jgi:glycosyltransferase involved in cell wall biosynthesis